MRCCLLKSQCSHAMMRLRWPAGCCDRHGPAVTACVDPLPAAQGDRSGFTLVELLVVITIIVLLLALLAPALDQAIYQAQLAQCGAGNEKVTVNAVTAYAMNHQRRYPYRSAVDEGGAFPIDYQIQFVRAPFSTDPTNGGSQPFSSGQDVGTSGGADDRPELMPYMPLEALVDPLTGGIDIDPQATFTASWIGVHYSLSFGYQYRARNNKGMFKMGDRLEWLNSNDVNGPKVYSYGQILGDVVIDEGSNNNVSMTHPNKQGTLFIRAFQNRDWGAAGSPIKFTASDHYGWPGPYRVPMFDANMAYPDGSVHRFVNMPRPPAHHQIEGPDPDLNPNDPNPDYPLLPAPRTMLGNTVKGGAIWLGRP
jgi:prepilin-type N-terminal cleavage/methylation domain-containing protein